ncbi:MAG: hypothetical protein ACMXYG_03995 [Candidatus Woesearchaeota archaeon]
MIRFNFFEFSKNLCLFFLKFILNSALVGMISLAVAYVMQSVSNKENYIAS